MIRLLIKGVISVRDKEDMPCDNLKVRDRAFIGHAQVTVCANIVCFYLEIILLGAPFPVL